MRFAILLALGGVAAWGQESSQQASDRLEIKEALDTWYRIEQGLSRDARAHCGWARERVRPVKGREWKYEYSYESAGYYEHLTESDAVTRYVQENVTAQLDAAFDILTLDAVLKVDQRTAKLEVRATSTGRTAEITGLDGRGRKITESGESAAMYTLALAMLRERQKGELRKPGKRDVVLVDAAFEFDNMKLRQDVKSEGRLMLSGGRRVPVIPVEFRPGGSEDAAKPTISLIVDRYGRIAEVIGETEAYVRTVAENEKDATPEMGIKGGRRDPMAKPMTPKGKDDETVKPLPAPLPPGDLKKLLTELERRADKVTAMAKESLTAADDLYEDLYTACVNARKQAESDPVTQGLMDVTLADAHRAVGNWEHELRLAVRYLEQVRTAVDRESEADARAALAPLAPLPKRILGGRDPAPKLEKMVAEAQSLIDTIAARRELQGMKLVLSGASTKQHAVQVPVKYTVCIFSSTSEIDTTVRVWVRDEWAIINDTVYRVGDVVSDAGVKVEKITQYGCTVSYKGAQRELTLSK